MSSHTTKRPVTSRQARKATAPDTATAAGALDLLTYDDLAAILKTTPDALRKAKERGQLPRSATIQGRVMFRRRDVEAWVDQKFEAGAH